jgi:photosystem II stability/assembly factor-like uncharacterized protein
MVPGAPSAVTHRAISLRRIIQSLRAWQAFLAFVAFAWPLALVPLARSQGSTAHWERVGSYPGDVVVRRVAVGQSQQMSVLYVVGTNSGLHLSVDGGAHWSQISGGLPQGSLGQVGIIDLAVDLGDPGVAYIVVESPPAVPRPMVYWTADMGLTWQPRASLGQERVRAVGLAPQDNGLYVVTANDVLRAFVFDEHSRQGLSIRERFVRGVDDLHWLSISSFDGRTQATLLAISSQPVATSPAAASADAERASKRPIIGRGSSGQGASETDQALTLYVGTRHGGLRIVVDSTATDPSSVLARDDADTRYVRQQATIQALSIDPQRPSRIYVGTERGVYASEDAGVSWYATGEPLRARSVLSLLADPAKGDALFAGLAGGGVFRSEDAGASWQPLGNGLGHASVFSLAVSGSEPQMLYAATDNGLWRLEMSGDMGRAQKP